MVMVLSAKLVLLLCVLLTADGYYWSSPGHVTSNRLEDNETTARTIQPTNDTSMKYVYKHVQIGSANIPIGGRQAVPIVQPNQTLEYIASVDTTIIQPSPMPVRYQSWRRPKTQYVTRNGVNIKRNTCFKCPSEQIVIGLKSTDSVLLTELPAVTNCLNQILPRSSYKFQPLAGDYPFLLPQGSHSFLAKIINLSTNQVEQLCSLKYRVIIHRCPTYSVQNRGLRIKCSLENLWGSSCSFTCKDGGYMSLPGSSLSCNDHLEWTGEEPYCHYNSDHDNEIPLATSCDLPVPPKHGKFTCDSKAARIVNGYLSTDRLPEGSMCRIKCNRHFEVAKHLERYARFSCTNGHWNSTMMEFCTRVRRKNN